MTLVKFKKKKRPRHYLLRTYRRWMAEKWHHCDACPSPIMPGDSYRAEVQVIGRHLYVSKYHDICPPDPYEEERKEEEEREARARKLSSAA